VEKLIYIDGDGPAEPVDLRGWESAEVVLRNDGGTVLVLRNGEDHKDAMAPGALLG
jgi:hypothetical protein